MVDASVAIKWYLPEIHADAALACLDDKYHLHVPDLFHAEFGNILWKKCRVEEITYTEAITILDALITVPLRNHRTEQLLRPAFELAVGLDSTVYDSVYLALAVCEECRMMTADRKFYDTVAGSPYSGNILWVEELRSEE